jgi:hypothetical protein
MPLEILHGAFVLFRSLARFEGAEVAALAGLRIYLPGIEPVFAGLQFADHGGASFSLFMAIIVIAARLFHLVVPGRAIWRGPGIHSPGLWIPGSLVSLAPRNDEFDFPPIELPNVTLT